MMPWPASMLMGTLSADEEVGDGFPDYWYETSGTTTSVSNEAPTAGLSLVIDSTDIKPNTNYLVIWSAEASSNTVSSIINCALYWGGSARSLIQPNCYSNAPQDWHPVGGFRVFEAPAVPVDVTFSINVWRQDSEGTAMMRNKRLTILKLGPDDEFAQTNTQHSTISTSYVTAHSLTVTPPSAGNYLFLASFSLGISNSAVRTGFKITDGGANVLTGDHFGQDDEKRLIARGYRYDALAAPITWTLQHKTSNASASSLMDEMCIVALRLDRFIYDKSTHLSPDNTGTNTSYTDAFNIMFNPPTAGDHLFISVFHWEGSDASLSNYIKIDDGEYPTILECVREARIATNNQDWESGIGQNLENYTTANRTQTIFRKSETTGTTTRLKATSALHTISLVGLVRGN